MKAALLLLISCLITGIAFSQTPNLQWANVLGGTKDQYAISSTVDGSKNVYTIYLNEGGAMKYKDATQADVSIAPTGNMSAGFAKYDPDGKLLFFQHFDGMDANSGIKPAKIQFDGISGIYLIGTMVGAINFQTPQTPYPIITTLPNSMFVARFDLTGKIQWLYKIENSAYNYYTDIVFDKNGNFVLSGSFNSTGFRPKLREGPNPGGAILTRRSNGATGFLSRHTNDAYTDERSAFGMFGASVFKKLAMDNSGGFYFIGDIIGNQVAEAALNKIDINGSQDIIIGRHNVNSDLSWRFTLGGATQSDSDSGYDIALDDQDNVYITGSFSGTVDFDNSSKTANLTSSETKTFLAKYDKNGNYIWAKSFNACTGAKDAGHVVKYDPAAKRIILGGAFTGCADFGGKYKFTSKNGESDIYIATLDVEGAVLNVSTLASEGPDRLTDLDLSGSEVVLSGSFKGTINFDFANCPQVYTSIDNDGFVLKYDYDNTPNANILTFRFDEQLAPAVIDKTNHIVVVEVSKNTNLGALKPYITIPVCATISPVSEATQNFTQVFEYLVTDKLGNKQIWKVLVNQEKADRLCATEPLVLAGRKVFAGSTIKWEVSENGGAWTAAGATQNFSGTSPSNTTQLVLAVQYRSIETIGSLSFTTSQYSFDLYPAVLNKIGTTSALNLCPQDTGPLTINDLGNVPANDITWEKSADGVTWSVIVGQQGTGLTLTGAQKGGFYRRKLFTTTCVSSSNIIQVNQYITATISVAGANIDQCENSAFTFSANTPAIWETGTWTVVSPLGSTVVTPANAHNPALTFTLAEGTEITLMWTIRNNYCPALISTSNITLRNSKLPELKVTSAVIVFQGSSIKLPASLVNTADVYTYSWAPATGLDQPAAISPNASPQDDIVYKLTVTNASGCKSEYSVNVTVNKEIKPVNVFTPNNDGINDTWMIGGATGSSRLNVRVYNRYGQLVFQSLGYKNRWDGTHNNSPLPAGTYYYVIQDPLDNKKLIKGPVTIMR